MKLVLHLVRNDLWRLRAWLAAGICMLLAMDGIGFGLIYAPVPRAAVKLNLLGNISDALVIGAIVLAYVLVLLLVQGDRVIGATAFWRTRPIAVERLLAAKLIAGLVMLVVIPTLVLLPWWLWCGFGGREIVAAIRALLVIAIFVGGPAALVAALADSIGRAILWGVVVVPLSAGVAMGSVMAYGGPEIVRSGDPRLAMVSIVLVLVAAVYVMFLSPRGRIIGIVGVVVLAWAPAEWSSYRDKTDRWDLDPQRAQSVGLVVTRATTERARLSGEYRDQVNVGFEARDLPAGTMITGGFADLTWSLANGVVVSRRSAVTAPLSVAPALGLHAPAPDPETQQWIKERTEVLRERRARQGLPTAVSTVPARISGPRASAFVPVSIGALMTREAPRFTGVVHLRLMRPRIVSQVPISGRSGWHAGSGVGFRIASTEIAPTGHRLEVVDTRPVDVAAGDGRAYAVSAGYAAYLVVQPGTKEVLMLGLMKGRTQAIGFVNVRRNWFEASVLRVRRGDAWVPPEHDPFEGAELAQVVLDEQARFTRDVTSDALKVESLNPPPAPAAAPANARK